MTERMYIKKHFKMKRINVSRRFFHIDEHFGGKDTAEEILLLKGWKKYHSVFSDASQNEVIDFCKNTIVENLENVFSLEGWKTTLDEAYETELTKTLIVNSPFKGEIYSRNGNLKKTKRIIIVLAVKPDSDEGYLKTVYPFRERRTENGNLCA